MSFIQALQERGAEVLPLPAIKIMPPENLDSLNDAITGLNAYDWVVFTSPNGVKSFFEVFFRRFKDMRDFGGARIAAVGPATKASLNELHLQVDVMPKEYVASQIADALAEYESMDNLRILLLRATLATPELPRLLEDLGAIVDDIPCYQTVAETGHDPAIVTRFLKEGADWITFTSGSTVVFFHARFNLSEMLGKFPGLKLATIGPETTQALQLLGLQAHLEAKTHTLPGLIEALEIPVKKRRPVKRDTSI